MPRNLDVTIVVGTALSVCEFPHIEAKSIGHVHQPSNRVAADSANPVSSQLRPSFPQRISALRSHQGATTHSMKQLAVTAPDQRRGERALLSFEFGILMQDGNVVGRLPPGSVL